MPRYVWLLPLLLFTLTEGLQWANCGKVLVGAYYYTWYGKGYHWPEGYAHHPLLGEYCSGDVRVADTHIVWAIRYGVSFFVVSWWGPNTVEEEFLKEGLLRSKYLKFIKFAPSSLIHHYELS